MEAKVCRWDCRTCVEQSCGSLDAYGNVVCCNRHKNPCGRFNCKLSKGVVSSIFSKHSRRSA